MLGNKNTNKKTVLGGAGIALLLCALMVGMTMTNYVPTSEPQVESELAIANEEGEDVFALPDVYEPANYEYDETSEYEGMRTMHQKAFRTDDGKTTLITAAEPLHYMSEVGSWEQIDLNIKATADGWGVTESLYKVSFSPEVQDGVSVQVHSNVDPIVTGLNPTVVTIDETGTMTMPHVTAPSLETISVGGNVLRYPLAEGFDLDYTVTETQLKQNLVVRERPVLDDSVAYFGVSEQMRLPVGYGLYLGDDLLREEITQTQDELTIRNMETGELLATVPVPVVIEPDAEEPYHATYFIQVFGHTVVLTTAVDADWLMDEDRQFPLAIDPSIKVMRNGGGDCYSYYGWCYNSVYGDLRRNSYRIYYMPWNIYTFGSSNQLPSGAVVDKIEWKTYIRYGYSYSNNAITATVLENCGTSGYRVNIPPTASCSGAISANLLSGSGSTTNERKLVSSLWNSASAGTYSIGTGWKTASICSSSSACNATTGSHNYIMNAISNGGTIGMGAKYTTATTMSQYSYSSGSTNSYLQVTYSGGTDSDAPKDGFVPYTGITSYKGGERTFFTTLTDISGIDTTSSGAPHLHYSLNNGSYTAVKATSIGSCGSSDTECQFRATTASISTGNYVKYFWAFKDKSATPNNATSPSGGDAGTPSTASAPSSPYWFMVEDKDNAGNAKKFTVATTDVRAYTTSSTAKTFDRQMTYYEDSKEYVFEFDTSDCGTGSNSCFYTFASTYYANWRMMWTNGPTYSTNGFNGATTSGTKEFHTSNDGYLSINAKNGPGMNLIFLYDSSANDFAMVGLGTDTGIEEPLSSGTQANQRSTYGSTKAFLVDIPGDITGTMGKFDWNATYSSSTANWMCVGSNGFVYFFRSTSTNPSCNTGYYYAYSPYYRWSGFALGTGGGGVMAGSGGVLYKVGKVAPEPDTSAPFVDHGGLRDSHSRDRTLTFTIGDAGEPPTGVNVSTTPGEGPTFYWKVTDANGTAGSWDSKILSTTDRAGCATAVSCDWTTSLQDLERGSTIEYYITVKDTSIAATGTNTNTTSTNSFSVGDPNKVFVIEWHDMGYTGYTNLCTFQVLLYDETNEIEFHYDTACKASYDYQTVGYQDQTRTKGDTLRTKKGYVYGQNPHTDNYRIGTDSSGHSSETFDLGMTELPTYDVAIAGSSNGYPYGYYCTSSYYWNSYKSGCNANIDMPDGFTFEYFGTEYNGSDSKNRVHIGRMGNMYFKADGSTALERSQTSWGSNWPELPYAVNNAANMPGTIAPWWGYYTSYYCYDNTQADCSVRTRVIPFEGKGTDVSADITQPTTWGLIDSPIRVNPSSASGYLSIGDDLTIEPGVVVQVASGKGLSFDGACSKFNATGNSTDPVVFEGQNNGTWKGLAFTAACSTGTDDRHLLSYVDFKDTSDAAIAAGSRHGAAPSSSGNVGNFTMDHVTFTNVGTAFKHGSGQGTIMTMTDFEVNSASDACFDLAEDSNVTLRDGEMNGCNSNGNTWGGAVINYPGSTSGALNLENVVIDDSKINLIDVDFEDVWISNLTATTTSTQSGTVLTAAGSGTGSSLYIYNMDAPGYSDASIESLESMLMEDVDWGSADVAVAPGGSSSTALGPHDTNAAMDNFTAGDLTMARTAPSMHDLTIGALSLVGNSPSTNGIRGSNWDTSGISVSGCMYNIVVETVETDYIAGSCSLSAIPNNMVFDDVDATYTGTMNAIYARNSAITIADGSVSMPSSYDKMSKASTNGRIVLIDVDQDGTDCESASDCVVSSSSTGAIYFGGYATAKVFKLLDDGSKDWKEGHTVQATVVDAGSPLFAVGTHKTDSNGETTVWVLTENDAGDAYSDHDLVAFGPSGQNETLHTDSWYPSGGFGSGDTIELRLEPTPVLLNGTNMDCEDLKDIPEAFMGYDDTIAAGGTNTFTWEGKVDMTGNLNIDDCNIVMRNVWTVASDATSSPKLTISSGGTLTLESITTSTGTLRAASSSYPVDFDMAGGDLVLDGGIMKDIKNGVNLDSGTLTASNSAIIYGNANAASNVATLMVNGGTLDWDDSTIQNSGQTGIGLMFNGAMGAVDNIIVKNAETGIYAQNSAPQINGFTLNDNDVGLDVYGGMSLPTIYRSPLLSGENSGWKVHEIDMTNYLGEDYIQIGYNSVYGGGNAHPFYNSAYSKYYFMTDRMNVELTDNQGNSWNITSAQDDGYYDGSSGGASGIPSHNCNAYGYSNNPAYYAPSPGYSYREPAGWDWEQTDESASYVYQRHWWGYYTSSWQWSSMMPPEGYVGSSWGGYNICADQAYSYYNSPGDKNRLTMPVIDLSGMTNLSSMKVYLDVLHYRADNYQDRIEFVARTGSDPADLGAYLRESGTPVFADGTITGADTGVELGGNYAAAAFSDITVTSPNDVGFEVVGSTTSTMTNLTVTGGSYGIMAGSGAAGSVDFTNVDISGTSSAGVYYIKDMKGELSGNIGTSAGPAIKFGAATSEDITWSGMNLATNAIGVETAGDGRLTFIDSAFANTKDVVITGSAPVDFIEGTIDTTTAEVTGTGILSRMRHLDVTVTADTNAIVGTKVVLKNGAGEPTGSATTDASGIASDMTFTTETVDDSGLSVLSLAGYQAVTVAKVGSYYWNSASDNAADFRYAFDNLSLTDAPGNSHSLALVETVDVRLCYSSTLSSYPSLLNCPGQPYSGTRNYNSGLTQVGYYRALPNNLQDKVVMIDFGLAYMAGGQDYNFNGSTVLITGSYGYDDATRIQGLSPYNTRLHAHNSDWVSLAMDGDQPQGFQLGYEGRNWLVPNIENSTLSGVASIATNYGIKYSWSSYYNWEADFFNVRNSTISHFRGNSLQGASTRVDECMNSGVANTTIIDNIVKGCGTGIQFTRTAYSYYHTQAQWGADGAIVHGNDFIDTEFLDIWFYFAYADDVVVTENTFSGTTSPLYNVYTQSTYTTNITINDNTFNNNGDEPIYLRGAQGWTINGNTIYGDGDSSHPGIRVYQGFGTIDGNTLVDADGGIVVDGVAFNYVANITNNDISTSAGRTAPSAVGIWVEDCGTSPVNTGGNSVTVMENALVTDGCDVTDTSSTLTALGGSGGNVYSVQALASTFTPSTLTINVGDTVRWRQVEYDASGNNHDVTANDTSWGTGSGWNLGSTFTKTFSAVGTYDYHCSVHPSTMFGTITVVNGTGVGFTSTGVNVAGPTDEITLSGTSVSGFSTAVEQNGGELTLSGNAILSGGSYGVDAEDTDVIVNGATLTAGSTGSAMYVRGASTFDATDMSTYGLTGLDIDAVDFRWNGGDSGAVTALLADGGAEGSVENVTWSDVTTQIDAGAYVTVTSVGNTVDASKLILDSTAVIHEGNLLDLNITHKTGDASDVGLLIKSTDGAQAAYVSPAYRTSFVNVDGDMEEWFGNVKNPSDDAMPGVMSSNGTGEDFLATWDANNLHLALTGVDMGSADLQIYIDSSTGGDSTGQSWYVSHSLPFAADYVFWAEDGNAGNSGLKVNGFSGWSDVTCSNLQSFIGYSGDTDTEISIPWDCIGQPASNVRMIVIVQDESTGAVNAVHPTQNIASGAVGQTFSEEMTLLMGHGDLDTGLDISNHLLIYRSYVGSNTPTDAKQYDISAKVEAPCAEDWDTVNDVDMSTNRALSMNIERACPVIQNLVDITVNEDSGLYTLQLLDKADDVQDVESTLTWTVADDTDPSQSPSMLLASGLVGQTMSITPDHDQFGTYTFHFGVEDSHGLTDSETIVFTVVNVNDAPIICNSERDDCMPVFADDGDNNLNVLDEGFGSVSKVLGSAANATGSYVIDMASNDMANEQPQQYTWGASIKSEEVTVEPYWVQKKFSSVAALFAEAGAAVTANGGFQDIPMTGDPLTWAATNANGSYTLPTLNDVALLTYLLAQNGCGSVWYQEYMDSSGNKVTAVRSDDGCDSTIDANAVVYNSMNYTDFWSVAYGVDITTFDTTWDEIFPNGYSTTGGYDPCPAFSVSVVNNELIITENQANELGGECTIVLTLNDDGGYCQNTYLGRTTDSKAACVSYTWLVDYPVTHPVFGPIVVTGCANIYLGLASFVPQYLPDGTPTGMTEDICLAYGWVGENTDATPMEVDFAVTPVNDAPEVLDWNRQTGVVISDGNGEVPNFPWKVTLTEDDESVTNLTYDLSAMKHDNDHEDADLAWNIVKSDTCDYENYFSATIVGDDIVFDLIKDATTNAPEWERDYLNNGGIHQKNPISGEFCPITLELRDTATAPSYIPNYVNDYGANGTSTGNYQPGEDSVTLYIRVDNVAENVPDYYLDGVSGFDFNEVTNIMPKTMVPTTVTIGHGGDEGPYNYAHMLEVSFYSNGYESEDDTVEGYVNLGTQYVMPPAYGDTMDVHDMVYITSTTTRVWVEVDVLTCVDESCDLSKSADERYFGYDFPQAHACIQSDGTQGSAWSCPGEVGSSSVDEDGNPSAVTLENKRRPMLEDQDWCNNLMTTLGNGSDCAQPRTFGKTTIGTDQPIPTVVRLIGTADVPSFAPSLIAISAAGLFVSALVLQSRREEEEEALEEMTLEDDEQAVSPVIATILMVAITVVLSGVIYVWASSLADTEAKGVPRVSFTVDSSQAADDNGFHRITITGTQVELATQAIKVTFEYTDPSTGETVKNSYNLADPTVYGFYPGNSDSMITFGDSVGSENGVTKSSLDTGDTIYVRSTDDNGELLEDVYLDISYVPSSGQGNSVLRTWSNL